VQAKDLVAERFFVADAPQNDICKLFFMPGKRRVTLPARHALRMDAVSGPA